MCVSKCQYKCVYCCCLKGFEQSTESRHVMELGEKLATFDIETDTDISSVYPTDTGQSVSIIQSYFYRGLINKQLLQGSQRGETVNR